MGQILENDPPPTHTLPPHLSRLVVARELDPGEDPKGTGTRHQEPDVVENEHVVAGGILGRNELQPVGGYLEIRPGIAGHPAADQLSDDLVRACRLRRILQFPTGACCERGNIVGWTERAGLEFLRDPHEVDRVLPCCMLLLWSRDEEASMELPTTTTTTTGSIVSQTGV